MASTRTLEERLANAAADLARVRGADADRSVRSPFARACANLATWAGRGAGRSGFTGSRGGGHQDLGDRVAAALDSGTSLTSDQHADALGELQKQAIRVEHEISRLRKLVDAATTTKPTAAKTLDVDYCRLCALVGSSNIVYARGLCAWCWRLSQDLGLDHEGQPIDPHTDLVRMHNEGRKVTENAIARYHSIPVGGRVVDHTNLANVDNYPG